MDIESLLRSLDDRSVEYVLIGATAFPDRPEARAPPVSASGGSAALEAPEAARRDDLDAPVTDQVEQVLVPGDDGTAPTRNSRAQNDAIARVPAHLSPEGDRLDHFEASAQQPDRLVRLSRGHLDLADEVPTDFLQDRRRRDRLVLANGMIQARTSGKGPRTLPSLRSSPWPRPRTR